MSISDQANEIFEKAKSIDLSEIKSRYQEEQELPLQTIEEHFDELLKYLTLCSVTGKHYGMRGPIDECWHTFIIFTKIYADFCQLIAGNFIHHFPNVELPECPRYSINKYNMPEPDDDGNVPRLRQSYLDFLNDYALAFGSEAPKHLWPKPVADEVEGYAGAGCVCGCGCRCIA